jgi:NADH dehydrogenase [ubiquinone] 1 alpha subcomplex assembly factor 5
MAPPHQIFDRQLLTQRRTRAAASASRYDFLLRHVAADLLERLSVIQRTFPVALNLGAHHGLVGDAVARHPAVGYVIQMDPAGAALEQCKGPRIRADEELLPFAPASLDLVVSGLALQFVNDLPGTLLQLRHALKPDGLLLASLIGGQSLHELRQAFYEAELETSGGVSPRVAPFADVRDLGSLLQRAGFALPVVDSDTLTVTYPSPIALMHDLRGMGATNILLDRRRTTLSRQTLMRMMEIYVERFSGGNGRNEATFEIITLTAWAPHASQQQPLQRGSAQTRLADVLGGKARNPRQPE